MWKCPERSAPGRPTDLPGPAKPRFPGAPRIVLEMNPESGAGGRICGRPALPPPVPKSHVHSIESRDAHASVAPRARVAPRHTRRCSRAIGLAGPPSRQAASAPIHARPPGDGIQVMTPINRVMRQILDDPWTARIFLAFTVGMFLSCSAEFASGQDTAGPAASPASVAPPESVAAPGDEGQALPMISPSRSVRDAKERMT